MRWLLTWLNGSVATFGGPFNTASVCFDGQPVTLKLKNIYIYQKLKENIYIYIQRERERGFCVWKNRNYAWNKRENDNFIA